MKHYKVTLWGLKNKRPLVQTYYTHAMDRSDAKNRAIRLCVFEPPETIVRWEVSAINDSVCPEC